MRVVTKAIAKCVFCSVFVEFAVIMESFVSLGVDSFIPFSGMAGVALYGKNAAYSFNNFCIPQFPSNDTKETALR